MKEERILRKMQKGDPDGLSALMDSYIPYVSTVVWNILRSAMTVEDAEEVVSDVFLAAWEQADQLQPGKVKAATQVRKFYENQDKTLYGYNGTKITPIAAIADDLMT